MAIDLNKSFSPTLLQPGQISTITIDLVNNEVDEATNVALTDIFPDDVFVATPSNVSTSCGGTITATNDSNSGRVSLSGGRVTERVGSTAGSCVISVDVYAATKGTFLNTIASNSLTGLQASAPVTNSQPAEATLAVVVTDFTGVLSLGIGGSVLQGNETSTRTLTLTNPNDVALTGVGFTHDLSTDQGYNLTASGPVSGTCGGSTNIASTPGPSGNFGTTSVITTSNAVIPANGSCTITWNVTPSRDVTLPYDNTRLDHAIPAGAITSTQGAANSAEISDPIRTKSGIRVTKLFNGSDNATLNTNTASGVDLSIAVENFNGVSIPNFDLNDLLPSGLQATNVFRNTCGGVSATGTGGNAVSVTGASLGGASGPLSGTQSATCNIDARIEPTTPTNATYTNEIPDGTLGAFEFDATQANVTVTNFVAPEDPLDVTKAFSLYNALPGDFFNLTFTLTNSYDEVIRNIDLYDDLVANMTSGAGMRIGTAGLVSSTCSGTVSAPPQGTVITISDVELQVGTSCTVTVQVTMASNVTTARTVTNTVPTTQMTFDLVDMTGLNPQDSASDNLYVQRPITMTKVYVPDTVAPGAESRLELRFNRHTQTSAATSNIAFSDTLPAGHLIAPTPNVLNTCGGTATANAGSNTITLSGGALRGSSSSTISCSVFVTITSPNSTGNDTNTIPAGDASATDDGQPLSVNAMVTTSSASDTLTRALSDITLNKEFLTTTIKALQPSRVRITFANLGSDAVDLTGLSLTDQLTAPLELSAYVDPQFTDTSGLQNANGCRGGTFSQVTGAGGSISLIGAEIDAATTCYFEFNTTSRVGGNVTNTITIGDTLSDQGATNQLGASATLTVERELNISKGFFPPVIEPGATALFVMTLRNDSNATYNQATANDPTADGSDPFSTFPMARDAMPSGVILTPGTAATSCSGGTASIDTADQELKVWVPVLSANTDCTVSADVTVSGSGLFQNTIPIGTLQTQEGATNVVSADADIRSVSAPTISQVISPSTIPNGGVSTVTFTLTNPNDSTTLPSGLSGASFSNALTNMEISGPPNVSSNCPGMQYTTATGGSLFSASNILLLPSTSCVVSFDITSTVVGTHSNASSGITTDQTPTEGTVSNTETLTVVASQPVTIAKSFNESTVKTATATTLTFTLTNPNAAAAAIGSPGFTDTFPTSPGNMVATGTSVFNSCLGTVEDLSGGAVTAADTGIRLSGGSVPANGSCIVTVDVEMDAEGSYSNTTSGLTTSIGANPAETSGTATDTITVANTLPIASAPETDRSIKTSDNAQFVNSILGSGDTIGGNPAVAGSNVSLSVLSILDSGGADASGIVSTDSSGMITVNSGAVTSYAVAERFDITYQICQIDNLANCATQRTERVFVEDSTLVATQDFSVGSPLSVPQADFAQEPGNLLASNDTIDGVDAVVGPSTGGNVDLTITSVTGPSGPTTALSVNVNTGIIAVASATPAGDYTIVYQICEDDNVDNCASASEVVRVTVNPIFAAAEANRSVVGSDSPVSAGSLVGSGDTLSGTQVTVGSGATGTVDMTIDSILDGLGGNAASLVSVDPDTGSIVVAGGAPDDTYVVSYTICEEANRSNCATASETIVVASNTLIAGAEADRNLTGSDGALDAGSALNATNDQVAGAAATLGDSGNATIAVVARVNTDSELSIDPITGKISVAAETAAGNYTIEYMLCEKSNSDNCQSAIERIVITNTPITAVSEAARAVFQSNSEVSAGSSLGTGDVLNAAQAVPGFGGNVVLSLISATGGLDLDTQSGAIRVPADTPVGNYSVSYQICENANRDNCDTATETVNVTRTPIVATAEANRALTGADASLNAGSVLGSSDTLNSAQATVGGSGNVVLSTVVGANTDSALSLNSSTGILTVAAGTAAGNYSLEYRICEATNTANCSTAIETVTISNTAIVAASETRRQVAQRSSNTSAGFVLSAADTIGGSGATPGSGGNVVLTLISADTPLSLNAATGEITVAANTAPGVYDVTYQICEPTNLDNCATATEEVEVSITTIQAVSEAAFSTVGNDTDVVAGNIIGTSDLLNSVQATVGGGGSVTLSVVSGANTSNRLSLDTSTGVLSVLGGTINGSYTLEYSICEVGNGTNCATAIESVSVGSTSINAAAEATRNLIGSDNALSAGNVLSSSNDTLNGSAATPGGGGNVILSLVSGPLTSPGLSLNANTGDITVAAGQAAGSYTLRYRICEATNTDNCAEATENIQVADTPILAGAEAARTLKVNDASQSAGNVLAAANDTLSGTLATVGGSGTVTLTTVPGVNTSTALTLDATTGELTLAADAPAANYTLEYRICEVGNADNCATAIETVTVTLNAISATGANWGPFDSAIGGTTQSVLNDDLLDGATPTPGGSVILTVQTPASNPGVTLDTTTGTVSVAIGTPQGIYTIAYRICEQTNTDNCATATETIEVVEISAASETFPPITTNGGTTTSILASDEVGGGPADPSNVTITVQSIDDGLTLDHTTGFLTLAPDQPAGDYTISYQICSVATPSACTTASETVSQSPISNIETWVSFELQDNGDGVSGVGDTVIYSISVKNTGNVPLEDVALKDTLLDLNGRSLQFNVPPTFQSSDLGSQLGNLKNLETAAYQAKYVLTIPTVSSGGLSYSTVASAMPVFAVGLPGTPAAVSDISDDSNDSDGNVASDPAILLLQNSLAPVGLTVNKTTPRGQVQRGAVIPYTITVRNDNAVVVGPVSVVDTLPAGFNFIPGSGSLNGTGKTASVAGRVITFGGISVPPLTTVTVTLNAQARTGVRPGKHVNSANVINPTTGAMLATPDTADVLILPEPVFDCGDVIGKVFNDKNRDGRQQKGEPGLGGIRLVGVDGTVITTDDFGRYHVPCAMLPQSNGSGFVLKLDPQTMPTDFRLTTENPRLIRLTPGKVRKMNFGAALTRTVRIDLSASAFSQTRKPSQTLETALVRLAKHLDGQPVAIRLAFHLDGAGGRVTKGEARQMMRRVDRLLRPYWKDSPRYSLTVEKSFIRKAGGNK